MKILMLSDLHLEFAPFYPTPVDADVVVLAGDIWTGAQAIPWARKTWPDKPIIYVAGNHEYYKRDMISTMHSLTQAAQEHGVHFLEKEEVIIDGVRFLGTTLWTDFKLFGENHKKKCLALANQRLNDFKLINVMGNSFTAEISIGYHEDSVEWLADKLIHEKFDGPTVVVTHHSPHWGSVAERYQKDFLSACFSSRLDYLMGYSELWLHGHMHDSFDYVVSGTRVMCNPQGYNFGRVENMLFDPCKVVEITKSQFHK